MSARVRQTWPRILIDIFHLKIENARLKAWVLLEENLINSMQPFTRLCFSTPSISFSSVSSFSPLPSVYALLNACRVPSDLYKVHGLIIRKGLEQDQFIVSRFISSGTFISNFCYSASVFDRVVSPNTSLWNCLLRVHCEKSDYVDTISIFVRMKRAEVSPDRYTYPSVIKSCVAERKVREGRAIHGSSWRCGVVEGIYVMNSLINFYGKCGEISCARKLFDGMSERNVVSWTAMIVAYVSMDNVVEAKKLFDAMPQRDLASWNAIICGFVKSGDLDGARIIFEEMPEKDVVSFTTMIDGYAKGGDMVSARRLFEQAPVKDIIAWSAMINGYSQNGQPYEAVNIFLEMESKNVKPDEYVVVSLMSACSQLGNLDLARWVDRYLSRTSIDVSQSHVLAALINMNAKCGNLERAAYLFDKMHSRDLVSYCSVIQGFSAHGNGQQAVSLFKRMLSEGLIPDEVAFTVILTACSRAGLVDEGWYFFELMKNEYSRVPSPDHYACIVDLLSRSGRLKAAYDLLKAMPVEPHACAWGAILWGCKLYCDVELGEEIAHKLFEIEPQNADNYVMMSNIYAAADRWLDASDVREKMKERGVGKVPGMSWI